MTDSVTQKSLSPEQYKAIESLLTAGDRVAAATAAGVSRTTIYRWMTEDDLFISELRRAENEAIKELSRALVVLADSATAALRDALGKRQKITVRLRAAEIVTDRLLKVRELVDLESRLSELEQVYAKSFGKSD